MKIIFLGMQGSGKSTQAKIISQRFNLPYLEMGQLLRDKAEEDSADAALIRQALETGNLVSDEITVKALKEKIESKEFQKGYILDGYPRNEAQLHGLPEGTDKVFYIKLSDEEAIERLLKRARKDDTLEIIKRRLELFHQSTEPLLDYFRQKGILEEIDGMPKIEEVTKELIEKVENGANQEQ